MIPGFVVVLFVLLLVSMLFLRDRNNKVSLGVGCVMSISLNSLLQDFVGKEAVLKSMAANWTESAITGPLALMIVMICLWILTGVRAAEKSE